MVLEPCAPGAGDHPDEIGSCTNRQTLRTRVATLFEGLDPADLAAFERVVAHVIPQVMTRERPPEG